MSNFTSKTFKETYRDSFNKQDGYHRVLFNSGKALQARELNELQSILHEEIARFGSNIFKEGALVQGGGAMVDNSKEYIVLQSASLVPADIVGQQYQNSQGITFTIDEYHADALRGPTLIVAYTDTTGATETETAPRVSPGETLTPVGATTFPLVVENTDSVGTGSMISVADSVYFVRGNFVHVDQQSVYIDMYDPKPTVDFGFKIVETIVTESDDVNLFDNQGEFPNIAAPGAHRLQIKLTPTTRDQVPAEENFVFVARIANGLITRQAENDDAYNIINDLLATRTKEESGDYVAKEFKTVFQVKEDDDSVLDLEVTPGTAYVDGYRLNFGTTNLDVVKARSTALLNNDSVIAQYGNYVVIDPANSSGLIELVNFGQVNLGGTSTANVRGIEAVPTSSGTVEYRLYLFNIQMEVGASFRNVATITGAGGSFTVLDSGLQGSLDNTLLFPLSNSRPQSITDTNFTAQRTSVISADSNGEVSISETLNASYLPVIFESGVGLATGWNVSGSNKITGLTPGSSYIITYYFEAADDTTHRTKTRATEEVTAELGSGATPAEGPFFDQGQTMWRVENNTGAASIVWEGEMITTASDAASITTLNELGYQYTRGSVQTPTSTPPSTPTPTSSTIDYVDFVGNYVRSLDFTTTRTSTYGGTTSTVERISAYTRQVPTTTNQIYRTIGVEGSGGVVQSSINLGQTWFTISAVFPQDHPGPVGGWYWAGTSQGAIDGIYYQAPDFYEMLNNGGFNGTVTIPYTRAFTRSYVGGGFTRNFTATSSRESTYSRTRASSYTAYYTQGETSNGGDYTYYEVTRQALASSFSESSVIELDFADGIRLVRVIDSSGNDVTSSFDFDGGQRDNFYGPISLKLKPGLTAEVGSTYTIRFEHYLHGEGDYFNVHSYGGNYATIPTYKTSTGTTIELTDVLDFRPVVLPSGVSLTSINALPKNRSIISVDATYYLPRIDTLVANTLDAKGRIGTGRLQVIQGESSLDPRPPQIPTGSLPLFQFDLNPYTVSPTDLAVAKIPHKRFTMKDIAKLEERVEDLYELTTLSILEADTASLMVLDSNNNNRTKSGFIADNFNSLNFCDLSDPEYRASVEPVNGELMPPFRENSIRLAMRANSTAHKQGDVAIIPFAHDLMVSQLLATGTMNVNPFAVITQTGHMTLSPASDEWVEVRKLPDIMQNNIRRIRTDNRAITRGRRIRTRIVERTIQEFLGEQVVDVEVVPFMRSREIFFRVEGLRPNTNMFAFFGNKAVQPWVRQESEFKHFSDNPREYGSEFANATNHPSGNTDLVTDSKGVLIGSFFLPNTPSLSFRTGQQEFKLLDISINDDEGAIASSRAMYESVGRIDTVQRTIRSTRIVESITERYDPLAQTFFVDQIENPNGLYLSKVKIFMESKDETIPLQVQIRPVENGIPTTRLVPGSSKFVSPSDINTYTLTDQTDIADVRAYGGTEVEFDEPVYLSPGEEYAIVLLAESVKYNAYVAETYEFILGPNQREGRVNKQPTLGSLFLSQNGSTWTADQTKDLMFELYNAEFQASADVVLSNVEVPKITLGQDPISVESGSLLVHVSHLGHGFVVNDEVTISGVQGTIGGVPASSINGTHIIASVSWDGYRVNAGTEATASVLGGGSEVVVNEQIMLDEFIPNIASIIPNGTNITATVRQTSGASFGGNRNNPNSNTAYRSVSARQVFLNDANLNNSPTLVASPQDMEFVVTLSTVDPRVSPLIDLQRTSVMTVENVIDMDAAAQHITTPVILDESAEGLKVLFSAHRPSTAQFEVYVKTATDESGLQSAEWIPIPADAEIPSDESREVLREYTYSIDINPNPQPDDENIITTEFSIFQTKLVMKSTNSSKVPIINDFRVIALAV